MNVSFQALSRWEKSTTCPDITLLPDIAHFFGITVDELLQVTNPLFRGMEICGAPSDSRQIVKRLQSELNWSCFEDYRNTDRFAAIVTELNNL